MNSKICKTDPLKSNLFKILLFVSCFFCTFSTPPSLNAQEKSIYQKGWIDFNKNGVKDIFEDPKQAVQNRINDLLSKMTMEEKTNQLATLYGFGRVLNDELPTPEWSNKIWKDGIANIDEHLNFTNFRPKMATKLSFPYSLHAQSINTVQKWFVENAMRNDIERICIHSIGPNDEYNITHELRTIGLMTKSDISMK
jgi:beta-glucosidase